METKIIGNKITEARKKLNISQAQLAEQLFISPQAVGKWERGESLPDIITCVRLAEIFGTDLNFFSDKFEAREIETPVREERPAAPKKKKTWDMSSGNWVNADFSGLKNLHEKFGSSNMKNTKFVGSELSGILLESNSIDKCDFSNSDMSNAKIKSSYIVNNQFQNCSLKDAEFSSCHITNSDFSGTDFTGATFSLCSCGKNPMMNAVLNGTSFLGSDLIDLVFEGEITDCYFDNCAFQRTTFQNSTITNTFFKGRSLKKIKFVNCKADRLTYEFLKNGKADLSGITLIEE